jgi:hypothetical protein
MCSGAADSKAQTRVLACTAGFADARLAAHSIAAMHASTTHARARKRSRVATTVARLSTFSSLAAFLGLLKEECCSVLV